MAIDINVKIEDGATNITSYVIEYTRNHDLCTGIGTLELTVDPTYTSLIQGNVVTLTEDGNKIGEFHVTTKERRLGKGDVYGCQDDSKWLQQYFVPNLRKTGGGTSRYWIQTILGEAQVSYNFTTADNGYSLPLDDDIGLENAYEIVMRLCQQSGWYFYFDGSGICQIGDLDTNWHNPSYTIATSNGKMLQEELVSDDGQLRNRVVVWGGAIDFSDQQMYTSLEVTTAWDRDAKDKRTIVYSNNFIRDFATAWRFGKKLMDEYSKTTSLKTYTLAGYVPVSVGDVAYCSTIIYNGVGRVSTVQSTVTADQGFRTTIVIDKRCPRIFAYWNSGSEYIYAGTQGSGVWRKPFDTNNWTNYSTGLTNLVIHDLKINSGFFACTADNGLAFTRRIIDSSWTAFTPEGFVDENENSYLYSELVTAGVGLDHNTNTCYFGYYHVEDKRSWVVERFPDGTYSIHLVSTDNTVDGEVYNYTLYDSDHSDSNIILSAYRENYTAPFWWLADQIYLEVDGLNHNKSQGMVLDPYTLSYAHDSSETISWVGGDTTSNYITREGPIMDYTRDQAYFLTRTHVVIYDNITSGAPTKTTQSLGTSYSASASFGVAVRHPTNDNIFWLFVYEGTTTVAHELDITGPTKTLKYTNSNNSYPCLAHNNTVFHTWIDGPNNKLWMYSYNIETNTSNSVSIDIVSGINGTLSGIAFTSNEAVCIYSNTWIDNAPTPKKLYGRFWMLKMDIDGGGGSSYESPYLMNDDSDNFPAANQTKTSLIAGDKSLDKVYFITNVRGTYKDGATTHFRKVAAIVDNDSSTNIIVDVDSLVNTDYGGTGWWYCSAYNPVVTRDGSPVCWLGGRDDGTLSDGIGDVLGGSSISFSPGIPLYGVGKNVDDNDGTVMLNGNFGSVPSGKCYDAHTGTEVKTFTGLLSNVRKVHVGVGIIFGWADGSVGRNASSLYSTDVSSIVPPPITPSGILPWPVGVTSYPHPSGLGYTFGEEIKFSEEGLQVEISRNNPILYFGGDSSDFETYPRGLGAMYFSSTGISGDIYRMSESIDVSERIGYITDARSVELLGAQSTSSGIVLLDQTNFQRYNMITNLSGEGWGNHEYPYGFMYYHDAFTISNPWLAFSQVSGHLYRMETTNYYTDPWIFTSTSGAPSQFWQMASGSIDFVEHSNNLPSSNILVIRADDRI